MLWSCLFGHADRVRERLDDGTYALVCPECHDVQVILPNQDFKLKPIKPLKAKRAKRAAKVLALVNKRRKSN